MPHADWLITGLEKVILPAQEIQTKTAKKKCFLVFSTKSEQIAIQQSHLVNPLLTSLARTVRESIAFGFYRTDLAASSRIYQGRGNTYRDLDNSAYHKNRIQ